jgi:glycerol-3-phosphate dehydrogenase
MALGTFDRNDNLARLGAGRYDLLVVGGGITGAGVALDAAARGLRTALVERHDFASGTSSRSSKLVHGGLRYLQNGDVRLVYEALHERQRLLRNAPHLVKVLPFLIPVFTGKGGIIPKQVARALGSAMWMYDLTGGLRIGKVHRRLKADAARAHMPTLDDRLAWAYLYYDAQTDDARLTLAVARTAAVDFGATVVNHAAVTALRKDGGRVVGAVVDTGAGEIEVDARVVVNATGVWADDVRQLDEGIHPRSIRPAKGIHITVPWDKIRNDIAAVVPVPKDRRSIFVVPWPGADGTVGGEGSVTYIGTTDTDYDGDVDEPQCTPDDVAYLLDAINRSVREPLGPDDVLATWAGLRPLVSDAGSSRTADLSRRHRVTTSEGGMVTVTGGKLTTYR